MDGVEIIKTVYEQTGIIPFRIVIFSTVICISMLIAALIIDKSKTLNITSSAVTVVLAVSIVSMIIFISVVCTNLFYTKDTDKVSYYEVAVSDEVSINEFYDKYKIIEEIDNEAYSNIDGSVHYYKVKLIEDEEPYCIGD